MLLLTFPFDRPWLPLQRESHLNELGTLLSTRVASYTVHIHVLRNMQY